MQGIHLLALCSQVGFGLGQLRAGHAAVGGQGSDALLGDIARLAQGLRARQVDLGAAQRGLPGGHIGLAGGDQAGLLVQAALCLRQFRLAGGQGGAGAFQGQLEIGGLQGQQQLAFFHVLVVRHQHLLDTRAQLAGNPGDLALYVGVVGAFVEAPDQQPVAEQAGGDQGEEGDEDGQTALQLGGHGELERLAECKQI